ncbi:MAG: phage holin family protein [Myxococcales bacterium]|nr:phage holin family protein [Myxococcales bacterium]MCB9712770.1 phage holin family protein [Myxococcales bacterium]
MMPKTTSSLVLAVLLASGCAGMQPKSGVAPTGEPLSLSSQSSTHKETVSEKVGESDHYDADGNYLGSSEQYQDRTVTHSSFHWHPEQGNTPISDEDLFRLAGDTARADQARRYRRRGTAMAVGGGIVALAGTGLALAVPIAGQDVSGTQGLGMYIGGATLAGVGGLSFALGFKRMRADGHPFSYGEAQQAIDAAGGKAAPPPPPMAALPRPAGRSVMVGLLSRRF